MPVIATKKEYYPSIFPTLAAVKIEGVWRAIYGDFIHKGNIREDMFVILHNGEYLYITYPDYQIYDADYSESAILESVCSSNIRELDVIQTTKRLAQRKTELAAAEVRPTETAMERANRNLAAARTRDLANIIRRQEEREELMAAEMQRLHRNEEEQARLRAQQHTDRWWGNFDNTYYYNPPTE